MSLRAAQLCTLLLCLTLFVLKSDAGAEALDASLQLLLIYLRSRNATDLETVEPRP